VVLFSFMPSPTSCNDAQAKPTPQINVKPIKLNPTNPYSHPSTKRDKYVQYHALTARKINPSNQTAKTERENGKMILKQTPETRSPKP
jgi:hypothetical protein